MGNTINKQIKKNRITHRRLVKALRKRKTINVVFIVSSLSMWQHQEIYDLMAANPCFNVSIIFVPFNTYSEEDTNTTLQNIKQYFQNNHTDFQVYTELDFTAISFRELYKPDIMFYPQWYSYIYDKNIDISSFFDILICLIPYSIGTTSADFCYNCDGNNYAWKQYLMSQLHKKEAEALSVCKGDNVVVTGYPKADLYRKPVLNDPWKPQPTKKKRVIWAPHFTITKDLSELNRSTFLQVSLLMWKLTQKYEDTIQFAFKPHPRLLTELYKHPNWGKEKTDAYYNQWANGHNTQLEMGNYTELFITSDAMIHDCGSFTAEYHYTLNPIMFLTDNPEKLKETEQMSEYGCRGLDAHYKGLKEEEICSFLTDTVINGHDIMRKDRELFYQKYLSRPNNKKSVSQLIYEDICKDLWVDTPTLRLSLIKRTLKRCHQLFQ